MARRRNRKKAQEETIVDIVEVRDNFRHFLERNQKILIGIVAGAILLVAAWLAYHFLYQLPREEQASEQMFQAERQFEQDSFALSLINPGGGYDGFLDIIEKYDGTDAANLAKYYAGVSYLNLRKFEAAIGYLEDYDPDGKFTPIMKYGIIGDAYGELENWDEAIHYYEDAVDADENEFLTPYYLQKLGLLHEKMGNTEEALDAFRRIKQDFATSQFGITSEKYIRRLESK